MKDAKIKTIHALEFACQAPLKFYQHCSACPRFAENCPDLKLGQEILKGKKQVVYARGGATAADDVHASTFKCFAPIYYFEKTRTNCGHQGRCREEGLLLALLSGKRTLDYSQKVVIPLAARKRRRVPLAVPAAEPAVVSQSSE